MAVNRVADRYSKDNIVGTIGVISEANGIYNLDKDVRGLDLATRDKAVSEMKQEISKSGVAIQSERISRGEPVHFEEEEIIEARRTIETSIRQKCGVTYSSAGHDALNAAKAGHKTYLLFCQSKDGIAHNPLAYTRIENIKIGAQALASLVWQEGNKI